MKKKLSFSNFGFSTILLCFVMICVVTFSALSLVSSFSDYKLSKKVADKNTAYYHVQEVAYEKVADIDALAVTTYKKSTDAKSFYETIRPALISYGTVTDGEEGLSLTWAETLAEDHFLQISLRISYPTEAQDAFVEIVEWRSYYEKTEPEDEVLDLIQ